jgi:protein TonB
MSGEKLRRYLPLALGTGTAALIIGGIIWFIVDMLNTNVTKPKKNVQFVSLVPPPPPPPPPEVEQPPEPEIEEKVEIPEPEQAPEDMPEALSDDLPSGDDLGLDADGGAGGDAFGLLARKGGRDFLAGSSSGKFSLYTSALQDDIQIRLSEIEDVRKKRYTTIVKIWIARDGRIEEVELLESTGDKETDKQLQMALAELGQLEEAPPQDMPQPIKLRITSRL